MFLPKHQELSPHLEHLQACFELVVHISVHKQVNSLVHMVSSILDLQRYKQSPMKEALSNNMYSEVKVSSVISLTLRMVSSQI